MKTVTASSFADPEDIAAFKECKARGNSDEVCFRVGDNGIGCYGLPTYEGSGPSCALPPEDTEEKFGSVQKGRNQPVKVTAPNGKTVVCLLKDRMPRRKNIKNGAGIDLNPDAVKALGYRVPLMLEGVMWEWA